MSGPQRVLVAGATGYVGRFAVEAFRQRGHWVRALTRDADRLAQTGPFATPAIGPGEVDDVFVGELTRPETLEGLMDGIDVVFSSVGISRQRDRLTFEQVDYQCNHTLIEMAERAGVGRFVYVSMQGADDPALADLAITRAHERVVAELEASDLDHRVVRPCGYFSDMGALLGMAKRGRSLLVGDGSNRMSPIHGRDLAQVCVDVAAGRPIGSGSAAGEDAAAGSVAGEGAAGGTGAGEGAGGGIAAGDSVEVVAGGPEVMTQREAAELAFEVLGKTPRIHVLPMGVAKVLAQGLGLVSRQFGDLAEFIVVAGEVDGVGPPLGTTTLRTYFERLAAGDPSP